jgi:hypothetical protein
MDFETTIGIEQTKEVIKGDTKALQDNLKL